jgi:probable HAF family extracellular repeat protein
MQHIRRRIFTAFLALATVVAWAGTSMAAWTVTDLGVMSDWGTSNATGINNNGQIVGYASTGEYTDSGLDIEHAVLWSNGTMTDLGVIGGSSASLSSYAYGINDNGQVVGTAQVTGGTTSNAFLYSGGSMQDLGFTGSANGINSTGQITGSNTTTNHGFVRDSNGTVTDIGTLSTYAGARSHGSAINSTGQVAAYDAIGSGQGATAAGWIWTNGTRQATGALGGSNSTIYGINNAGQAVGTAETQFATYTHAFLYSNGQRIDLGTLGDSSQAEAINNLGQVVGMSDGVFSDGLTTHAVLWTINADGSVTMTDLNDLIEGQGWYLGEATGINDKGQIVGWGYTDSDPFGWHGFVLSAEAAPVPLPPALYLFGSGLFGFGFIRRRFGRSGC